MMQPTSMPLHEQWVGVRYMSGNHDFGILKKLVLRDGSILRAQHAGRPTRDCLFKDPVKDGKSIVGLMCLLDDNLLKIWNMNKLSGIIGIFNCQQEDMPTSEVIISGRVSPSDVEYLEEVAGDCWRGDCAIYAFNSGSLIIVPKTGRVEVSLGKLQCELLTICPIRVFDECILFAPIGLLDMYNSGGAREDLTSNIGPKGCALTITLRGCNRFGAYSSKKPKYCSVDTKREEFGYNPENGLLSIKLDGGCQLKDIEFLY